MTANDTFMMENPDGRIFVHGIGNGAALLVVERDGVNLSLVLGPEDALNLGRMLFIDLGTSRRLARYAIDAEGHEKAPKRSKPLALTTGSRNGAAPKRSQSGQPVGEGPGYAWPPEFYEEVARYYRAADIDGYVSERLGHFGRTSYIADMMDLTYDSAKTAIGTCRRRGLLNDGDQPKRGRKIR